MMKRLTAALVLAAFLLPARAPAQVGWISAYGDPAGDACNTTDGPVGLKFIYVFHHSTPASAGARFKVQASPGFTGLWIADVIPDPFDSYGSSQTGIVVCYPSCMTSPIQVLVMAYFVMGTSSACSTMDIVADPAAASGQPEMVDCNEVVWGVPSAPMFFNSDGTCPCYVRAQGEGRSVSSQGNFCHALPVRPSTWGSLKVLYQ